MRYQDITFKEKKTLLIIDDDNDFTDSSIDNIIEKLKKIKIENYFFIIILSSLGFYNLPTPIRRFLSNGEFEYKTKHCYIKEVF